MQEIETDELCSISRLPKFDLVLFESRANQNPAFGRESVPGFTSIGIDRDEPMGAHRAGRRPAEGLPAADAGSHIPPFWPERIRIHE
jgi:hypothetical protein